MVSAALNPFLDLPVATMTFNGVKAKQEQRVDDYAANRAAWGLVSMLVLICAMFY